MWAVVLVLAWVALTAINYATRRQLQRLARSRQAHDTYATFRDVCSMIPEPNFQGIYGLIQGLVAVENFPIRPDDNLLRTLLIDDGRLADFLEEHLPMATSAPQTAWGLANEMWSYQISTRAFHARGWP
jgi:hypothetical protein